MTYEELQSWLDTRLYGLFQGTDLNQFSTRPIILTANGSPEEIKQKVDFYNELRCILRASDLNKLQRTASGAISKGPKYLDNLYAWDERLSSVGYCITVCVAGFVYVLKFGNYKGKAKPEIYPNVAFNMFKDKCYEYGIDLDEYAITTGAEVKASIPKPMIDMNVLHTESSKGLKNVHHIDFHNSYPAGLVNTHPEFKPVVEYFYEKRKEDAANKAVLNYTIGYMQSWEPERGRFAMWAHLSKDAIEDNNRRIHDLTMRLIASGRTVIGRNTDGIWYQGDIYHGDGEGPGLGQWENDHTNCTFRAKSKGAYEYIEDGQYRAVVRGQTGKDAIEPDRTKWAWGDIYKEKVNYFTFTDKEGIKYVQA